MPETKVKIVNRRGLHARAAAKFVKVVEQHRRAHVTVLKDDMCVPGASIMGLLMLGASQHSEISISASGDDGDAALMQLVTLVESGFGEDE